MGLFFILIHTAESNIERIFNFTLPHKKDVGFINLYCRVEVFGIKGEIKFGVK